MRAVREHPSATVIVTGCCADFNPASFAAIPGVDRLVGNSVKGLIARIAGGDPTAGAAAAVHGLSGRTRAFVKVQDGCDSSCSYCVVPLVRGRPRSRPQDEIIGDAAALAAGGYREIVLCGIRLGSYGRDRGETGALPRLIGNLERIAGLERIRLSSIEPEDVEDNLLSRMASGGKLCPHLHLPLQSGDSKVLRAMNRGYMLEDYKALIERARRLMPDVSLTTDIIVGFPGETEEAFARTLAMVGYACFSRVHIFPYSLRRGTAAWRLGDPVPPGVKERRREILRKAAGEAAAAYCARFIGRNVEVLVQGACREDPEFSYGLTREYLRVYFGGSKCHRGSLLRVIVDGLHGDGLRGRVMLQASTVP
jgi:threonylcarbamoyladenosine tRNA methylthiotransferase MtaB